MSKFNPLGLYLQPMATMFGAMASYYEQMAQVPAHQHVAPFMQAASQGYLSISEGMETIIETTNCKQMPEYSVETGGVVCRPAAWN